jgi:hypothetical protein
MDNNGNATVTMEERKEPRFVQFDKGSFVEGVLLSIQSIRISEKPAVRYTVKQDDQEDVSFIGTYQINSKLRVRDVGHRISVICEGEDPSIRRGDNCMKLFGVKVSRERVLAASPTSDPGITDADIPF